MKKPKVRGIFSGARGQRIFNILYSVGASIVILGALFKILHAYGADIMLIVGMGTEAIIFFLSAFDEEQMGSGEEPKTIVVGQPTVPSAPVAPVAPVAPSAPVVPVTPVVSSAPVTPVAPISALSTKEASEATEEYVKQLTELNETLAKLQASLSQNLQGLNAMYELQLRDAGTQLNAVNQVHKETEQMSETIKQLNVIYDRMLNAMKN